MFALPTKQDNQTHEKRVWTHLRSRSKIPAYTHEYHRSTVSIARLQVLFDNNWSVLPPWGNTNLGQSPYHDISSIVERYDRKIAQVIKLKTAVTCQNTKDWTETLSSIIPGLRTSYKFDILASAVEMLFGNPLRLRGEFFTNEEPTDPGFQNKLREHIRRVKPILPAHYTEEEFVLKDLYIHTYLYIWAQFKATRPILRRTTNIQNHKAYHR